MSPAAAARRPEADLWSVPDVPILARSAHNRCAERRADDDWIADAWAGSSSRVLVLSASGRAAVRSAIEQPDAGQPDAPDLVLHASSEITATGVRVLLGAVGGTVYFAVLTEAEPETSDDAATWRGLREVAERLTDLDVGLLTTAVALQAWHQRHRHCPRCGAVTEVAQAGWTRRCPVDASEHFPRTDPAVIMLVTDDRDRCVLARGPQWPSGRMSVLAGFVEAGESAEAAVAREVAEEVGIEVADIRYVASQPHPFPASLMLGFTARLVGDPTLRIDGEEIIEADWFSREQVRGTADWGAEPVEPNGAAELPALRGLPGMMSIARQLINAWLADGA